MQSAACLICLIDEDVNSYIPSSGSDNGVCEHKELQKSESPSAMASHGENWAKSGQRNGHLRVGRMERTGRTD